MRTPPTVRRPPPAAVVPLLAALTCAIALAVPALLPVYVLVVPWAGVVLVLAGVLVHRPRTPLPWLVLAAVLAAGALSLQLIGAQGSGDGSGGALALLGRAGAGVVLLCLAVAARRGGRREHVLETLVSVLVVVLAGVQLLHLLGSTDAVALALVGPTADLVLLCFVLRFAASRESRHPSWAFGTGALVVLVGADVAAVLGAVAPPEVAALQALVLLVTGCAALPAAMTGAFDHEVLLRRRPSSAALVGLLPLVLLPVALRVLDLATGDHGLPSWAFLAVGTTTAALCVLRACVALRESEHLAGHDPLTDLPNRRGLARLFDDAPREGWALLLVDLDDFKDVNDAHGHDVGDLLLLGVRDRLAGSVGRDGVVARFGGDEFVVLVRSGREEAVADRLLRDLRPPLLVRGLALRTSGSVGLAAADPAAGLSELLTRADVALYAAKGAGRDTVRSYRPEQRVEVQRRFTLTSQVRQLLGGRSASVGRLEVHYQPLVELASGEVVGAEALVRWRHPEHGLLPPDAFLGHVASSGLDAELDTAVLHEVLEQMGRWRDQRRRSLPVSVNLTRTSLLDPALADRVREALARAGVPGDQLHVEITEHEPLPDDDRLLATLHALRALGVEIHLDDYGTGYTSLDYLRRFPVRVLKVDRSVVSGVGAGGSQLVAGLGAMSRTLRLDLLAEGVETEEQRRRLLAQGVRLGQGWLFSYPLPATVYAERVLGRPHECLPVNGVPAPRLPLGAPADAAVRRAAGPEHRGAAV
ncbi:bifunctional diguanylate cyclase/phosphodiesterase [Pseudokineococcus basanitobsidens]|uniref:Bifunctional diguanylate cyclase/phosphodiesterase n=1 Tax=Pseudokineococcus basanitobsidens TaxID=1926649 RepID=A0ABU8RFG5_9ACTN